MSPLTEAGWVGPVPVCEPMPKPPAGYAACRVGYSPQITHLVILDSAGSNGGRPTMCRLTRFDVKDPHTRKVMVPADLPGWSMSGGVSGPGVEQVKCEACWSRAAALAAEARKGADQ